MYKIGVDIGGTNTDTVLVDSFNNIIKTAKTPTTQDIVTGFTKAIEAVIGTNKNISKVIAGTTHALNSILQAKSLTKIGVLRLAGYDLNAIPVCFNWPEKLKNTILAASKTVSGGYECDGMPITPLKEKEIRSAIADLVNNGAQGISVSGVFASLYPQQELQVKKWIIKDLGADFPVTLSSEIGGMGLIERENASILNVALQKNLYLGFRDLQTALEKIGLKNCELLISKNDGTVMSVDEAIKYPVLTLASGPKNSFVGGSKLAGLNNAVVVDVGGTSTDVGVIIDGFTRRSYKAACIAEVNLGFSMPDVTSIALGGGSHVSLEKDLTIGPLSVGNHLLEQSQSFGGQQLTLCDAAISLGNFCPPKAIQVLNKDTALKILTQAYRKLYNICQKMSGSNTELPFIMVGGGAALFSGNVNQKNFIIPKNCASANAYGAALSEIGATINTIIELNNREKLLEELKQQVLQKARSRGAQNPRIVELEILPYHYAPQKIARVIITAAGSMTLPTTYSKTTLLES